MPRVVDQTASEPRLHRALYIVKYMRAMVLNLVLVLAAVGLFLFAGIKGVYPLADDTINALQMQAEQAVQQGNPLGQSFVPFILIISAVTLAFFVWIYLSLTKVWCRSLKAQAIFLWLSALFAPVWAWAQVQFSLANLDPVFSGLVIASFAVMILVVSDMAYALWGVSKSPESSSFTATLDSRLAPGWWTYINKFLDLPRSPWRNQRVVTAYLLSVIAAVVLVASIAYLISIGGISNKLAQLVAGCTDANMSDCAAQASIWARQIPLWLAGAFVGVQAAGFMQSAAKQLGGLSVTDVVKDKGDKFILYLRPFESDDVILPKPKLPLLSRLLSFRPFPVRIEEEFFDVADGYRPLIAVGRPGEAGTQGGQAYRVYLEESEWQNHVLDRMRHAESIVMVLEDTKGVNWEISKVLSEGAATKTLFFFDPDSKDPQLWDELAARMLPQFQDAGLVPAGFTFRERPIAFYFEKDGIVEVQNRNWTATSYRTAFSSFLSERAA